MCAFKSKLCMKNHSPIRINVGRIYFISYEVKKRVVDYYNTSKLLNYYVQMYVN